MKTSMPSSIRCSVLWEAVLSEPETVQPCSRIRCARPDIDEPPIPIK